MNYGLTEKEIDLIKSVFEKVSEVETVFIYGSRAKNTFKKTSDIDLAVKFQSGAKDRTGYLKSELEDLSIIYECDLTNEAVIQEGKFKDEYERTKQVFYIKGWKMTTLGSQLKVGRGSSPRPIQDFISNFGIPWVKIADASASETRYIVKTKQCIKEEGRSTSVNVGDLIVSNSATPGIPKLMGINACVHDGWLVFSDYTDLDKLYLYYFFLDYRRILTQSASGTVFVNLQTEIVRNIGMNLPPIPEQRAIAAVLSSLDDKIELLREQNKTLEATAQAIFKEWFVRFNFPVESEVKSEKLKVKSFGYKDAGGKMIDSELGKIPEGWKVGKYSDLVDVVTGKGIKKEDLRNDGVYKVLGANGEIGKTNEFLFDEDLILTGRVGTLGTIFFSKGKVWISDNVLISKPLTEENYYFAYFQLKQLNFESMNRGSTQPLITQTDLKNVEIIVPDNKLLKEWHILALGIFSKSFKNNSQIQTLSTLRDALLPKLMKGEVRIEGFKK